MIQIACLITVMAACNSGTTSLDDSHVADSIELSLTIPDRVEQGEHVDLILRIANLVDRDLTVLLLFEPWRPDFIISDDEGNRVWKLQPDVVPLAAEPVTLPAGETLVLSETWAQTSSAGGQVPPGEYSVLGVLSIGILGIETEEGWLEVGPESLVITPP